MRKPLLKVFIIFSLILLVLTACDHNVYMGVPTQLQPNLWMVNGKYFPTLQEAMDYIYGTTKGLGDSKAIGDVGVTRRAILQRNVMNGERGGGLIVPADFKGQLVIDFNGFTYEFDDSLDHFFDVRGGDEVYIINGTTVIYNEASHVPFAIAVNTDTVTIDEHLIDDRRWDPTNNVSDAKLFDVGEKGKLRVVGIQETDAARLTGVVSVFTDGTSGGKLILEDSRVVITNILTRYKNPETGEISDSITLTTIPADARSEITISSGYVTINNIETLSDYYKKEGTAPAELYSKAILNIFSDDATNLTKIENPHDSTEKPLDTAIQTMINDQKIITETDVNHVIIHSFDDEHTHAAVDPTCTTPGNIYYVQCTYCGHYFDENNNQLSDDLSLDTDHNGPVIPALGHLLRHFDAVEPTCQTTGNVEYWLCERCGKTFADSNGNTELANVILDKVDHSYDTTVWNKNETNHWHQCIWCNTTTDVAGHTFTETVTVEPLEHTKGELTKICDVCGHTIIEDIPELDHVYVVTEVVEPTCTERGYTKSECGNPDCQEKIKYDYTDPLGHDGYDVDFVEATCQHEGVNAHFHCNRCNKDYWNSESIEPLTAADIVIAKKPHIPTTEWSSDGTSHWHICLEGGERLDESNHTKIYVNNETKHWHKCSVCGYLFDDEEPHSWTTLGNTTFCEDCGYIPPEETQPTYGGFDVVYTDPIPSGYLSVVQNAARVFTLTVVDTNSNSIPTKFSWYVDGTLVPNETSRSFTYHLPVPNSYEIMCVFSNSKGMGSASKTVYPSQ